MYDLLDGDKLKEHLISGKISEQKHPTLPLRIYNYTHKAQFEPAWGDGTIDYCRGLIVGPDNTVISRPFKKFHNLNTPSIPETMEENLPLTVPSVAKKLDGSLGIYYSYDGHEGIATRGSFTSPQASWATEWYAKHRAKLGWLPGYTSLFEIIYNENRIVLKYDFEGLVLIGLVNKKTGDDIDADVLQNIAEANGFEVAEQIVGSNLKRLQEMNIPNEEGYVLTYPISQRPPLKVKIKMADYVRLHRIVTGMNARSIWEILSSGGTIDNLLINTPEHFRKWLLQWDTRLSKEFFDIRSEAERVYLDRPIYDGRDKRQYRAECAAYFKKYDNLRALLFAMLDGKNAERVVWDMIEPRGNDRSFREDE
ncbi:MAG: hypothetical protein OK457_00635 [Thaumarchaeota archaeon]|nr:hypothetical protein [Nitrososphaerota archaeon]